MACGTGAGFSRIRVGCWPKSVHGPSAAHRVTPVQVARALSNTTSPGLSVLLVSALAYLIVSRFAGSQRRESAYRSKVSGGYR